jgi:putative transposase
VKFEFIDAEKAGFGVAYLCRQLEVSRSGYYAWLDRVDSKRAQEDSALADQVRETFEQHEGRYGSPRVHASLRRDGHRVGRHRVARLMREGQLRAKHRRRYVRTTDSNHSFPKAANVLDRNFAPSGPNRVWAGDITYLPALGKWLFLAVVLDLFSRRVVGWSVSESIDQQLALSALQAGIEQWAPGPGLVHHSDRGCQYAATSYRSLLETQGMVCSMSRTGNCWDNAPVESFFSTLKTELLAGRPVFESKEEAEAVLFEYIEVYYNRQRLHSSLGYLSPDEFEARAQQRAPSPRGGGCSQGRRAAAASGGSAPLTAVRAKATAA